MYYIGVDLGGTNIAIGIVNDKYEIVKKGSTPTKPERGADAIVADMATVAKNLLMELNIPLSEVASAVAFMASEKAGYVDGVTLNVAGGKTRG